MSCHSDRFKALKRKYNGKEAIVDRISGQQQLQKTKRGESFGQQRLDITSGDIDDLIEDVEMLDVSKKKVGVRYQWTDFLWSDNLGENLMAVEKASRFIRWHDEHAVTHIINSGMVPRLFELLFNEPATINRESYLVPLLKSIIAEVLARVSLLELGENNVSCGTIVHLVELLNSKTDTDLKNHIVLIVGNIASELPSFRDLFIQQGVIEALQRIIESTNPLKLLSNATWALSNMCCGRDSPPDVLKCSLCVPTLAKLIPHEDFDVMISSCHAMAYLIIGSMSQIGSIIATGVCPRLVKLLGPSNSQEVTLAALFTLSKIVLGTDEEVQEVIGCGALALLKSLLQTTDELVVMQSVSVIGNIAAGSSHDIQAVIDSGAMHELLNLVQSSDRDIKLKAAVAIRQSISARRTLPGQIAFLVSIDCIKILCQQLALVTDTDILVVVLRPLQTILDFGQKGYIELFLRFCSISTLEKFTSHENPKIRKYASKILLHLG